MESNGSSSSLAKAKKYVKNLESWNGDIDDVLEENGFMAIIHSLVSIAESLDVLISNRGYKE